jgi:adenosyl cobinamide kinase/adenosyl cobinamide phosphate guanylyltransferase
MAIAKKIKLPKNSTFYIPTSSIMDEEAHNHIPSPVHEEAKRSKQRWQNLQLCMSYIGALRGIS